MSKLLLFALAVALAGPIEAKTVTVKMLNSGAAGAMVFEPAFVKVSPGDSVTFAPTNPSHNAESITSMMPAGATPFKATVNQAITVKFTKPGVYGIKCAPHLGLGMVALVQVGNASPNLAQARAEAGKLPPLAKKRMVPLVTTAK
jgi:pseudoazurin